MKVKIKELAQESKFIRLEMNKIKSKQKIAPIKLEFDYTKYRYKSVSDVDSDDWRALYNHKKYVVGEAARAVQLAYGFLRGIPYHKLESKRKLEKEWTFKTRIKPEIVRLANKFGCLGRDETYAEDIEKWLDSEK